VSEQAKEESGFGILGLSTRVADLLLLSEGDVEWVRVDQVRKAWHLLFISTVVLITLGWFILPLAAPVLETDAQLTFVARLTFVLGLGYLLIVLAVLGYRHYQFVLLTSKDLRLKPIVFLYASSVTLFAQLYRSLFFLSPGLFSYPHPPVNPSPTLQVPGPRSFVHNIEKLAHLGYTR